jgi:hypothetical protein
MIGRRIRTVLKVLAAALILVVVGVAFLLLVLRATNPEPVAQPGWEIGKDMPTPRGEVAAATIENELVIAGGLRGATTTSKAVSIFDAEQNSWRSGRPLPEGRHHAAAAATGGLIYVSGGASGVTDWSPRRDFWRSSPGARWEKLAPMPEGRQGHAMVAFRQKLYVVGGVGRTDRTLIYDPKSDRWTTGAPLPSGRDHLRAANWKGKIWAIGGRNGSPTRRVDVYDPEDDEWERGPNLTEPMSAMATGVVDDILHVVGGEDPGILGGHVTSTHVALDKPTGRWLRWQDPPLPVHGSGFGVISDHLFIAGGASRPGALSTISWTGELQVFSGSRSVSDRAD